MTVFGFVVVFFVAQALAKQHVTWFRAGNDVRFVRRGTVLSVSEMRVSQCGAACVRVEDCVSFNYESLGHQCELLSAVPPSLSDSEMVASPNWSFYTINVPADDPCGGSGCPVSTMCIRYDQPLQFLAYDPSLPEYACSDNLYYVRRRKAGLTDCRLEVNYGWDLPGFDTAYFGVTAPYHVALQKCLDHSCVSMACHGTDKCYLKTSTRELNPKAYTEASFVNFWNPVCQEN